MRRALILLGFVVTVFGLGALLAVPVYAGLERAGWGDDVKFERVVSRTLMVLALAGVWPVAKLLGATWQSIGIARPRRREMMSGALVGLVSLGIVIAIQLAFEARGFRPSLSAAKLSRSILLALGAAVMVAPVEEILFRGVCFGLTRGRHWLPAALFSSVIFSLVHFVQTPRTAAGNAASWDSGLLVLANMFAAQSNVALALAQFVNLFVCGVILFVAFQRTGSLWFSIALHAGWIFWLKLANAITVAPQPSAIWGTRKVVDAWMVLPVLVATWIAVEFLTRRKAVSSSSPA